MMIKTDNLDNPKIMKKKIKTEDDSNPAKDQWFPSQCYKFSSLKKKFFSSVYFQSSDCMLINTAYRRLLKKTPGDIRKPKHTNRATTFSLQ